MTSYTGATQRPRRCGSGMLAGVSACRLSFASARPGRRGAEGGSAVPEAAVLSGRCWPRVRPCVTCSGSRAQSTPARDHVGRVQRPGCGSSNSETSSPHRRRRAPARTNRVGKHRHRTRVQAHGGHRQPTACGVTCDSEGADADPVVSRAVTPASAGPYWSPRWALPRCSVPPGC